jgi:hypothetical protein
MTDHLDQLIRGECAEPHAYLGAHPAPGGIIVRAFSPTPFAASS